jgi:hypothetical protein
VVRPVGICLRTDSLLLYPGIQRITFVDLSKATKLKDVGFRPGPQRIEWVTAAPQTTTPKHQDLRQITIHIPYGLTLTGISANIGQPIAKVRYEQWLDLDRLLVNLWESRSIRSKLVPTKEPGAGG